MQVISLPSRITPWLGCLSQVQKLFNNVDEQDLKVVIDFSELTWINAELCPFLGNNIRSLQKRNFKVLFRNQRGNVEQVLNQNNFNNSLLRGNHHTEDKFDTSIPFIELQADSIENINFYIENELFRKIDSEFNLSNDIRQQISDAIFEVADNTKTHSQSDQLIMCGQFYPKKGRLSFTICDDGIGIPENVNSIEQIYSNTEKRVDSRLINWATKSGNSTKISNIPRGLGLAGIMDSMKRLGELTIISNNGFWKLTSSNSILLKSMEHEFQGTLIKLDFLLKPDAETMIITPNIDSFNF